MSHRIATRVYACFAAVIAFTALLVAPLRAEPQVVRIAQQFGISYLPLILMKERQLLEKHGKEQGLELKSEWAQFSGGVPINEALISGNLDFASGGLTVLLTVWERTRTNLGVKGVAALDCMPLYLTTTNPAVKTIADFTEKDRIAVTAAKVAIQAITLQMAAAKAFGEGQYNKLDSLEVSMSHPDAYANMMGGKSGISAHFASPPYQNQELTDPRVHKVLDSYEVLGGPHTFNVVWATSKFYQENPKVVKAFVDALEDALQQIQADPAGAAKTWLQFEQSKLTPEQVESYIRHPQNEWTTTPKQVMTYADFMNRSGVLKTKPQSWKDVFFDVMHSKPGS